MVESGGPLITEATDTNSEYVIFIAFSLQPWLRERSPGSRCQLGGTTPMLKCVIESSLQLLHYAVFRIQEVGRLLLRL